MPRRIFQGLVTKVGAQKTVSVRVADQIMHPKYKKYMTLYKTYLAHDDLQNMQVGDKVKIIESRPMSKQKKWQVLERV